MKISMDTEIFGKWTGQVDPKHFKKQTGAETKFQKPMESAKASI